MKLPGLQLYQLQIGKEESNSSYRLRAEEQILHMNRLRINEISTSKKPIIFKITISQKKSLSTRDVVVPKERSADNKDRQRIRSLPAKRTYQLLKNKVQPRGL
jgi:hypothetical protein